MQTALPLNRKERYFTGTVLPMIVCADGFKDLRILASLMGCEFPPVESDPANANIQFFTEYSLVESIYGTKTKVRFPKPPKTKDLYLHEVYHAALLPAAYARKIKHQLPSEGQDAFRVVSWEQILEGYRLVRGEADYFLGMLGLALKTWGDLASVPLAYGQNAEAKLTGVEILRLFGTDASIVVMGRAGGIDGPLLARDVATDTWRRQTYEVSSGSEPPNPNWFRVEEFIMLVENRRSHPSVVSPKITQPPRERPPVKRHMTGEEIVARWDVASVRVVGRQGGQSGRAFAEDVRTGRWRTWPYEVSDELRPPNKNWFTVERFLVWVQAE